MISENAFEIVHKSYKINPIITIITKSDINF